MPVFLWELQYTDPKCSSVAADFNQQLQNLPDSQLSVQHIGLSTSLGYAPNDK